MNVELNQLQIPGERLLVKRDVDPDQTEAGVIVTAKTKRFTGRVVTVGEAITDLDALGWRTHPNVLFQNYAGTAITLNGDEYVILNTTEVLARWPDGSH